jgi:hypothetical protein
MMVLSPAVAIKVAMAEEHAPVPIVEANLETTTKQPEPSEIQHSTVPVIQENPETPRKRNKPAQIQSHPVAPSDHPPVHPDAPGLGRFGGPAQSSHRWQTGFAVMPGSGYRLITPYNENQFCGDRNGRAGSRVCTQFVPFFTELQLSFGLSADLDVLLDMRFGLADEPVRPRHHAFILSPGIRFWLDRTPTTKFFSTLQFVYDYLDFSGFDIRSSDYGVRNVNGFMFDLRRNLGFFVQIGETLTFVRWFRLDLDLGLGIQLRLP